MKLAGKLARKFREFFSSDFPFFNQIRQKIIAEMEAKSRQGRAGVYVPSYYMIGLPEDNFSTLNQELKGELKERIAGEVDHRNFKLYSDLQFEVEPTDKEDLVVTGEFRLTQAERKEKTKDNGTKVFTRQAAGNQERESQIATIRMDSVKPKQACLLLKQEGQEKSFTINSVETNIGRQASNEITLLDKSVSRVHAQIIDKKYYYLIRDLSSTNGVLINGEFVQQRQLADGDKIKLGEMELVFKQQEVNDNQRSK